MGYKFSFEKLEVWQMARLMVKKVYQITENFPGKEQFGLTNQMRRAAVSVCANIAEGATRNSAKEQAYFTSIAYGSLLELLSHMIISADLNFISEEILVDFRATVQPLSVKINNLRTSQINSIPMKSQDNSRL